MSRDGLSLSFESMQHLFLSKGVGVPDRAEVLTLSYSQAKKKRQHGSDAVKSHIVAAKTVANIVKTSLV
jgi:hypothetical protein